jgi:Rps23 Pro-64 3,4-dihydroxylase Tpa1-like proline 4-hydroxylase
MTLKQILDSFSETLMQDERILSAQEQALLRNLLRHAGSALLEPSTYATVNATIASAVGETVAQRAFAVLGSSIVERILTGSGAATTLAGAQDSTASAGELSTPGQSQPKPAPKPPTPPPRPEPEEIPIPPPPGPPSLSTAARPVSRRASVLEPLVDVPAQCLVLDEFLAPQELQELISFTLEREADFRPSGVVGADFEGLVNETHRRSLVLTNAGRFQDLILERIQNAMPFVLSRLGMEQFAISNSEVQITASNDGDFFRGHTDDGDPKVASRQLTFVYFFHREPHQFDGGELRIYDPAPENKSYQTIVSQQNQIVFFRCSVMHGITPVECPSKVFADSRFTVNGWLHK